MLASQRAANFSAAAALAVSSSGRCHSLLDAAHGEVSCGRLLKIRFMVVISYIAIAISI